MAAGVVRANGPQLVMVLLVTVTLFAVDLARENRVLRARVRWHVERDIAAAELVRPPSSPPAETPTAPPAEQSAPTPPGEPAAKASATAEEIEVEPEAEEVEGESAVAAIAARPEDVAWPATGQRLRGFGWQWSPTYGDYRFHAGIDLRVAVGAEVRAALPGQVVLAGRERLWAYRVVLDHGAGLQTVYAHLREVRVAAGDRVTAGQILGSVGPPGEAELADGVLLHFEMRQDGHPVDPESYLR
jgi:murein DD-endopeptidase MepM/ murein hydrolase activator NlpD